MWTCKTCIEKTDAEMPKEFVVGTCSACGSPAVECANFNNGNSNWHKYAEDKHCSSSSVDLPIPENGLYLWLRPITQTSSR